MIDRCNGFCHSFRAASFFIFYMESISWTSERTRATFNMSAEAAENTKEMAFNQGFYNLFLALEVFVGVLVYVFASPAVGLASCSLGPARCSLQHCSSSSPRRISEAQPLSREPFRFSPSSPWLQR